MLEFISGRVVATSADAAVIAVGGVGIRVQMAVPDLARLDGDVTIHTVLVIKDDEIQLYGFRTDRGRELFRALTTVNGVGPRLALAVLSHHPPEALERILATADVTSLTRVSGVGKKIAERIALELRDKLIAPDMPLDAGSTAVAEVREALTGMGYTSAEVASATKELPPDGDVVSLLRFALRHLGKSS